jgi:hypothetical protein
MPIKVACGCGAAFAAKDELAGRTVACPKCKQPLTIPRPQAAAAPAAPAAPSVNPDLFDDVGLKARDPSGPRCPGCGADMAPNAVLCIKCGYNTKLGRRMETIRMSGSAGEAGAGAGAHGNVTEMVMARAAKAAEEDASAERSKTDSGAPLWVWITAMVCIILFGIVMSLVEQHVALIGTGVVLYVIAIVLQCYALFGIWFTAGKHNPLIGIGLFAGDLVVGAILIVVSWLIMNATEGSFGNEVRILAGAASIGYALTHGETCAKYMFYMWVAKGLMVVGYVLGFIGVLVAAATKEDSSQLIPPEPIEPPAAVSSAWNMPGEVVLCRV